jgi:hypothetical protein
MNVVRTGTLIGYDADSGTNLFTHSNRPVSRSDNRSALPIARDIFHVNGNRYRAVGVRVGSTATNYEIDVREEPDS